MLRPLGRVASERKGGAVGVAPLRPVDAARVLADASLVTEELVAAAAAALSAEVI